MTRPDMIAALGAMATSLVAKPSALGKRKKPNAPGTYDMIICQAGRSEGLTAQGSLTWIASQIDLFSSGFTCAALLILNHEYSTQLQPSVTSFLTAVGGLTPGSDTTTYNIGTWDAGQQIGLTGQGDMSDIENLVSNDAGNSSFTCAGILCINTGYQSSLSTAQSGIVQAIGNL